MSRAPTTLVLDLAPQIAGDMAQLRRALAEVSAVGESGADAASPASAEAAIHAARRCIKMLRATLRLIGSPKDDPVRKALDEALRTLAGSLSPTRDLHVAAAMAAGLRKSLSGRKRRDGKALRAGLDHLAREWSDKADAIERNRRVKGDALAFEALASLALELQAAAPVGVLTGNAAHTYRKARRMLKTALRGGDAEVLHAARGQVVRHQLQSKALRAITGKGKGRLKSLDALREAMGEHHDLAVMEALAGETPHPPGLSDALSALIRKRQRALEDACRPLANELFAAAPETYQERLDKRLTRALAEREEKRATRKPSGSKPAASDG